MSYLKSGMNIKEPLQVPLRLNGTVDNILLAILSGYNMFLCSFYKVEEGNHSSEMQKWRFKCKDSFLPFCTSAANNLKLLPHSQTNDSPRNQPDDDEDGDDDEDDEEEGDGL